MAAQGCKYILAVDVTTLDDRDLTNYGDHLSGWWLLWNKVNIFAAPIKIPTQADIQLRLAFWYVRLLRVHVMSCHEVLMGYPKCREARRLALGCNSQTPQH